MHIPSNRVLKGDAVRRVAASENAGTVSLYYVAIITISAVLVTLINYCLNLQIAKTGGLSNMGLRSMLSTIQSILPMLQNVLAMCLQIGYLAAIVRIARRQYTSPQTLRLGFDRFWLLLRTQLLQAFLYTSICMVAFWIAVQLFMLLPMSDTAAALVEPAIAGGTVNVDILLEETLYQQILRAMIPMFAIFAVLYAAFLIPVFYSLRMVNLLIVDKPGMRARAILRESRKMMKGNKLRLFRLDLGLWWWYLLFALSSVLCYGDSLLPMMGISLPMSEDAAYFLFYGLFLVSQFFLVWKLRSRVEVSYALFYDIIRPKEEENSVVLGNIFQM